MDKQAHQVLQQMLRISASMLKQRPNHPASLHADLMCRQLCNEARCTNAIGHTRGSADKRTLQLRLRDASLRAEIHSIAKGYETALYDYQDPATAMQHLLQCMMQILQVWAIQCPADDQVQKSICKCQTSHACQNAGRDLPNVGRASICSLTIALYKSMLAMLLALSNLTVPFSAQVTACKFLVCRRRLHLRVAYTVKSDLTQNFLQILK